MMDRAMDEGRDSKAVLHTDSAPARWSLANASERVRWALFLGWILLAVAIAVAAVLVLG
jgi:hypothetical protein